MNELTMWEDSKSLQEIKSVFAPKLNTLEFQAFVGLGKASGLNPFLRELWAVKYTDSAPAQIFIGRDGYRKAAQKNPEYDYHLADAVYENDEFKMSKGEIEHSYKLKDRGQLMGAYCIVKRHNSTKPIYVYVDVREYNTNQSVWKGKPATMVKKVAEAQALRAAFQEQFGGTYDESEMEKPSQVDRLNNIIDARSTTRNEANKTSQDFEPVYKDLSSKHSHNVSEQTGEVVGASDEEVEVSGQTETGEAVTVDQLTIIRDLMKDKNLNADRQKRALNQFGVDDAVKLTSNQADTLIIQLEKL